LILNWILDFDLEVDFDLAFDFDFGHELKRGGAVRGMSPRPSEGVSRVIPPAAQACRPWVLTLGFDFDLEFRF
jgi:hypothetical protein